MTVVPGNLFGPRNVVYYTYENFTKKKKSDARTWRHLHGRTNLHGSRSVDHLSAMLFVGDKIRIFWLHVHADWL